MSDEKRFKTWLEAQLGLFGDIYPEKQSRRKKSTVVPSEPVKKAPEQDTYVSSDETKIDYPKQDTYNVLPDESQAHQPKPSATPASVLLRKPEYLRERLNNIMTVEATTMPFVAWVVLHLTHGQETIYNSLPPLAFHNALKSILRGETDKESLRKALANANLIFRDKFASQTPLAYLPAGLTTPEFITLVKLLSSSLNLSSTSDVAAGSILDTGRNYRNLSITPQIVNKMMEKFHGIK